MEPAPPSATPAEEPATPAPSSPWPRRRRYARRVAATGLLGLLLWVAFVYADPFYERPRVAGRVVVEERMPGSVRVLTLNLAHGRGTAFSQLLTRGSRFRANLEAAAELILACDADVVALQELDAASFWSGGFDHLAHLAERTGYPHSYHGLHVQRARPRVAYGTGVLSRFPLRDGRSWAFGQNAVDTKGFVLVRVEAPGLTFDLVSVHLDFKRTAERRAQLAILSRELAARPEPAEHLVVAGDFNTSFRARSGLLEGFAEKCGLSARAKCGGTFPAGRPRRRIDYVFFSQKLELVQQQAIQVEVSDHLPVLAELRAVGH